MTKFQIGCQSTSKVCGKIAKYCILTGAASFAIGLLASVCCDRSIIRQQKKMTSFKKK